MLTLLDDSASFGKNDQGVESGKEETYFVTRAIGSG
jgi:hypothetical protein